MFSEPSKIVDQSGIMPGMHIADLGAGSGHFAIALAKALHATGRVYAVDLHQEMLSRLRDEGVKNRVYNIDIIRGDIEVLGGSKLKDGSVDICFLSNVFFQIEDKKTAVSEVKRILKPSGRAVVVDWQESFGGMGPLKESVFSKKEAEKLFEKSGFHLDREISAGSHHYGLIFKKM